MTVAYSTDDPQLKHVVAFFDVRDAARLDTHGGYRYEWAIVDEKYFILADTGYQDAPNLEIHEISNLLQALKDGRELAKQWQEEEPDLDDDDTLYDAFFEAYHSQKREG